MTRAPIATPRTAAALAALALAALLALLAPGCAGGDSAAREGLAERYQAEEAYWDADRYRDAFGGRGILTARSQIVSRYRRVLAKNPFTPWDRARERPNLSQVNGLRGLARLVLGNLSLQSGEWGLAEEEFTALIAEAVESSPLAWEGELGLARAAEGRGDFETALEHYDVVLDQIRPDRPHDAGTLSPLLALPLYLAKRRSALGDEAGADSSLARGERIVAALRAEALEPQTRELAGVWLTEIYLAQGSWSRAAGLLEERAAHAAGHEREALLLLASRIDLDSGELAEAGRLYEAATAAAAEGEGEGRVSLASQRIHGELLVAQGHAEEGRRMLRDLFDSGTGQQEEPARAGIVLGDLDLAKGSWATAVEAYALVEARFPLTEARVEATLKRARLLDARSRESAGSRARAVESLLEVARVRPGSRRSAIAEEGAALLLEELQEWEDLVTLLENIGLSPFDKERSAAALLRAAILSREKLDDIARAERNEARLERRFPGTLAKQQAKRLAAEAGSS